MRLKKNFTRIEQNIYNFSRFVGLTCITSGTTLLMWRVNSRSADDMDVRKYLCICVYLIREMLYLCLERRGCGVFANVSLFLPSEYLNDEVSQC